MGFPMEEIAPGIYVSSVYPGLNVGLVVTGQWVVAIDAPPFPSDHQVWWKAVRAIGRPIRYLILTDDHPDRLLGALWVGVPIIAGRGTGQKIRERGETLLPALVEDWNRRHAAEGRPILAPETERIPLPEIAVNGRMTLEDEESLTVESVAGPSAGSLWVWVPRPGVLFTGDVLPPGPSFLADAPSPTRWLETLARLEAGSPPARRVVPGRGPVGGPEIVHPAAEYLRYVQHRLQASAGHPTDLTALAEELGARWPTPEKDATVSRIRVGLERWLEEMAGKNDPK